MQFAFFTSRQRNDTGRCQHLGSGRRSVTAFESLHQALVIHLFVGRVLVDHEKFALVLDQPVGLEDLADDPKAPPVLFEEDLLLSAVGKIGVLKEAPLLKCAFALISVFRRAARDPLVLKEEILCFHPRGPLGTDRLGICENDLQ